ncbi:efflux RND transporter periplasmic adaptor subunit [Phenylobacterium sp.]|uniref:efflux RND transporter periplasmic adaptor subunit n=1 Tax=Phenylobacterium sp. TaxID=1871053 RepID=UPI00391CE60F
MDRRLDRPWWRKRRNQAIGGAALALAAVAALAAGLAAGAKPSVRVPAAGVTTAAVERAVFHDFVAMRATVTPKDQVFLDALEGGQVEQVLAHSGDWVAAGQPIIRFRNTELELEVLDREGRLVESITQLQAYEKQLEDARVANEKAAARIQYDITRLQRTAERRDALLEKGFVSREAHQAAHDELAYNRDLLPLQLASNRQQDALRRRQLPQIHAELESLRESLKITRAKLDALVLRAPVAGRLADVDVTVGEIRNRGQRLGQIVPQTGFELRADVDEYYLGRVRQGQGARIEAGGGDVQAKVIRVNPQVTNSTFQIELAFQGAQPGGLLPGQALEGRLTLGGDQPALVLPAGPFLERTGGDWVMVLDDGGRKAERRRVRLGRRNAEQVEVLSGLQPGERVITSDYAAFEKVDQVILAK